MNKDYKEALDLLQKIEERFNQREAEFKSAFESYNNAMNYLGQYSKFRLNFQEASELVNRADSAMGTKEYIEARKLAEDAMSKAQSVVGQSLPVIKVEMEINNYFISVIKIYKICTG